MKPLSPTIGISCIGSGVGQSVINSCRLARMPLTTVGLGANSSAYGLLESNDYAYPKVGEIMGEVATCNKLKSGIAAIHIHWTFLGPFTGAKLSHPGFTKLT